MSKRTKNDSIWKLNELEKKATPQEGVTFNAKETISDRKSPFFKKMPDLGRSKGTFGGGVSRP